MSQKTIYVNEEEVDIDRVIAGLEANNGIVRNASKEQVYTAMVKTAVQHGDEWQDNVEELRHKQMMEEANSGDTQ
jgi:hypothetical protein